MNDDWLPAFAKLTKREPEVDDPLQLEPNATSLEALQAIYRNPGLPLTTRMRAMISALPFETPKLAVTAQVTEKDFATLLDQRLKRLAELKLIEANGAHHDHQPKSVNRSEPGVGEAPPIELPSKPTPAPLNRLYDKRHWRRF